MFVDANQKAVLIGGEGYTSSGDSLYASCTVDTNGNGSSDISGITVSFTISSDGSVAVNGSADNGSYSYQMAGSIVSSGPFLAVAGLYTAPYSASVTIQAIVAPDGWIYTSTPNHGGGGRAQVTAYDQATTESSLGSTVIALKLLQNAVIDATGTKGNYTYRRVDPLLGGGATPGTPAKPTCTIVSPANNTTVTNPSVTIKGKTADLHEAVTNVFYELNGTGVWTPVGAGGTTNGFTNWSVVVPLAIGSNTIKLYAVNATNETSALTNKLSIFYKVLAPLSLGISGPGKVSPYTNNQPLVLDKPYTITATADTGCKFTNWTLYINGHLATNVTTSTLKFIMQSNLVIVATFEDVRKPAIAIAGPASIKGSNSVVSVSGTASDNVGVQSVYYTINSDPANYTVVTTNGYGNWTAVIIVSPGSNFVQFYAQDAAGNVGSAALRVHDLAGGFAPQSMSGVNFYAQPSNSEPYEVFLGMSTWAYLRGSNFLVGDYWYNQVDANTAQVTTRRLAPEAGAGGSDVTTLTFTSSTDGTYTDTNVGGTFTLGGASGAAPSNLDGASLEGATLALNVFTNHYTYGTFTADGLPVGVVGGGTCAYVLYSPQMALLTETFTNTDLLGETNFVLLDFEGVRLLAGFDAASKDAVKSPRTNSGAFYSAATTPVAAASFDSGFFTAISPATAPAGHAPESLASLRAFVTITHTGTNNGKVTKKTVGTPLISFGGATFGQIDPTYITNDFSAVGHYIYTRTGSNTGVVSVTPIAPSSDTGYISALKFSGPLSCTFSNIPPYGNDSGTVSLLQEAATVPASLVGSKLTFTSSKGTQTVATFGYNGMGAFVSKGVTTPDSYTFGQYGPQAAMLQSWDTLGTNYVTLWFTAPTSGSFVSDKIANDGTKSADHGTFVSP